MQDMIHHRYWKYLSYLLFTFVLFLIVNTVADYGITWDENVQKNYGNAIILWYASLFKNTSAMEYSRLYLYGGFFEVISQGITNLGLLLTSIGPFEIRHFINALFGLLGIIGAYKLGNVLAGPMPGFFSALFLTLTPRYYGHIFNNPKDIPFAVGFLFSLYYIIKLYQHLPRPPQSLIIKLGIAIGVTLGVRIGGILLFGYMGLLIIGWFVSQYVLHSRIALEDGVVWARPLISSVLCVFVIAWAVMLIWWPWAQISPLLHPLEALRTLSRFDWPGVTFFAGKIYSGKDIPWTYLPTWFAIALPEFYFITLSVGCWLGLVFVVRLQKTLSHLTSLIQFGILLFAFCFPITIAIMMHSTLYDGLRHFLFVIPLLAVMSGVSFAYLLELARYKFVKHVLILAIILSMFLTLFDMYDLHPYQTIYFNRVVASGLQSASEKYETDYWGNSYKEGIEWVINHYQKDRSEDIRVSNCSAELIQISYYLDRENFIKREKKLIQNVMHNIKEIPSLAKMSKSERQMLERQADNTRNFSASTGLGNERNRIIPVPRNEESDIVIATRKRGDCYRKAQGQILYTVRRKNVPILFVKKVEIQG